MEGLTAQSCDSSWNKLSSSIGNTNECSFKTLQLNKFGVYCDTRGEAYSALSPPELKVRNPIICFSQVLLCENRFRLLKLNFTLLQIAMSKILATNHDYLLCPVSAEARIAKNNSTSSLSSSSKPRFDVQLMLDKVPLQLTDSQYRNTLRTYRSFRRLQRHCRLRHYRPFVPIRDNVPEWWAYAFRAVLTLKGYKRRRQLKTMEEVLQRARDNVAYVKAYEQHLMGDSIISLEARQVKDRVEQELHFDEIIELREIVMVRMERGDGQSMPSSASTAQLRKETSSSALVPYTDSNSSQTQHQSGVQQTQSRYGIMSWLFPSWSGAPATSADVSALSSDMQLVPAQSAEGINNSMSFPQLASPSENPLLSPTGRQSETDFDEAIMGDVKAFGRDALLARFNFKLDKGTVSLLRKSLPFLEFDFTGVQVDAVVKPRSGSHKFQMTLSTVSLKDCRTKQMIVTPHQNVSTGNVKIPASMSSSLAPRPNSATHSKDTTSSGGESLFSLTYEKKPHKKAAHKIVMTTRPLDLILSPEFYEDLVKFFQVRDVDGKNIDRQSVLQHFSI